LSSRAVKVSRLSAARRCTKSRSIPQVKKESRTRLGHSLEVRTLRKPSGTKSASPVWEGRSSSVLTGRQWLHAFAHPHTSDLLEPQIFLPELKVEQAPAEDCSGPAHPRGVDTSHPSGAATKLEESPHLASRVRDLRSASARLCADTYQQSCVPEGAAPRRHLREFTAFYRSAVTDCQ
jgi:hypothetical protein